MGPRWRQALIPAQPMAESLGSELGSHRHNHLLERNPAIKLTAQITDFCLYNYTVHTPSGTGTHIPVSTLPTQPGDELCLGDTLHLLAYSIHIPMHKDAYKISICML